MTAYLLRRCLFLGLLVAVSIGVAGCFTCKPGKSAGKPLAFSLKITPGESLKESSAEVDVIGANPSKLAQLQNYGVKKYFKPGDPVRRDLSKITIKFIAGQQQAFEIAPTDAKWAEWLASGVQDLVVVADLPEITDEGKSGGQDPRRLRVPLCKCYWPGGTKTLNVEVKAGGVNLTTPLREGWSLPPW